MILLNIIGGVCLLLWGLRNARNGMTRAFGGALQRTVGASTRTTISAFATGIGVTAMLQSSTAMALLIAAFCKSGMAGAGAGVAVMLGADVGTSVVAQLLSLDLSWLAPLLIVLGYILHSTSEKGVKLRHVGLLIFGLGLMLFALQWIRQTAVPLADSQTMTIVLEALSHDMIMAVLVAIVITWLAHSSLATVLLLVSLVSSGVVPIDLALAMVLGANIGGGIAPVLTTLKDGPAAYRVPVANIVMRTIGVVLCLPFLQEIQGLLDKHAPIGGARLPVDFHLAFNIGLAAVFLPLSGLVGKIVTYAFPERGNGASPGDPIYLDEKQLGSPAVAMASASRETLRMADYVQEMLEDTIKALDSNDESYVHDIRRRDDIVDDLHRAIKHYMAKITREELNTEESIRYMQILSFAINLESIGDVIDKSLMEMAEKKIRKGTHFSDEGWREIRDIHNFVTRSMTEAQSVFLNNDQTLARRLIEGKDWMREAEKRATDSHLERIAEAIPETVATGSLHLDILRDYRRINSYIANVAYPVLEEAGLTNERLKPDRE